MPRSKEFKSIAYKGAYAEIPTAQWSMFKEALERQGLSYAEWLNRRILQYIRSCSGASNYKALTEYLEKYYPTCKSEESVAYWRDKVEEALAMLEEE